MNPQQLVLLIVIIALLICSAFFSAAETAYSSCNKIRLKSMESAGNKRAGKVLKQLDSYDKLISTVLVGNNIVNITLTALTTVFFVGVMSNGDLAVTLSTVATTVLVLIFGEITPKTLAKEHAVGVAVAIQPIIAFITVILYPVNWLFSLWKKLMNKIFKPKKEAGITEDELITIVETAHSEGGIDAHESQLIRSAIEFEDLDVDDIMVPRVNVVAIEQSSSNDEIAEVFSSHGFSRLPVYNKSIDMIIGVIHEKDFYQMLKDNKSNLKERVAPCICVAGNMKISKVLRMLQKAKVHMAIVVDEFGGTEGIITLEDILEELVGEIWDEHDEVEVLYKKVDDNTFLVQGNENLEDMFEELGVKTSEEFDSTSVGGFVIEQLQKIPLVGERFSFENIDLTVTRANAKRVLEVKIKVNEKKSDESDEKKS